MNDPFKQGSFTGKGLRSALFFDAPPIRADIHAGAWSVAYQRPRPFEGGMTMKLSRLLMGILSLTLIFGLLVAGCDIAWRRG
jgi:hypothetical protein